RARHDETTSCVPTPWWPARPAAVRGSAGRAAYPGPRTPPPRRTPRSPSPADRPPGPRSRCRRAARRPTRHARARAPRGAAGDAPRPGGPRRSARTRHVRRTADCPAAPRSLPDADGQPGPDAELGMCLDAHDFVRRAEPVVDAPLPEQLQIRLGTLPPQNRQPPQVVDLIAGA